MAALITYDSAPSTGKNKNVQMIGNNLVLYTGTFDMNNTATATIDLTSTSNVPVAATNVRFAMVSVTEAVSESCTWGWNIDGSGSAAAGKLGITAVADQVNNTGIWFAICDI